MKRKERHILWLWTSEVYQDCSVIPTGTDRWCVRSATRTRASAEIVRSGIMSIDGGQMEAGRSLGLNYVQTMWHIIIPQTFKNVLPALANEFIVLLKETSISGYVGIVDLTKGGDIIRGMGVRVESLARIASMDENGITFC